MNSVNIHQLPNNFNKEDFISKEIYNKTLDIEFIYIADFKNAKILRDFIDIICHQLGFQKRDISRLILVVDEISNNAIEYGSQQGSFNKLRIKAITKGDIVDLNIEIEDAGDGVSHKSALEMETLRAHQLKLGYGKHSSIRGRGLFMITVKTVDRLYFKDTKNGGLIVGIKKNVEL